MKMKTVNKRGQQKPSRCFNFKLWFILPTRQLVSKGPFINFTEQFWIIMTPSLINKWRVGSVVERWVWNRKVPSSNPSNSRSIFENSKQYIGVFDLYVHGWRPWLNGNWERHSDLCMLRKRGTLRTYNQRSVYTGSVNGMIIVHSVTCLKG